MNCKLCRGLFNRYEDDTLSRPTRAALEEHLQTCPECRTAFRHDDPPPPASSPMPVALAVRGVLPAAASLLSLFDELPLGARIARVLHGLRQPPESGEYKWARLQVLRLLSPLSGILVPLLLLLIAVLVAGICPQRPEKIVPDIALLPQKPPDEKPLEAPRVELPDPIRPVETPQPVTDLDIAMPEGVTDQRSDSVDGESSPQTGVSLRGVDPVPSRIKMVGIPSRMDPGGRYGAIQGRGGRPELTEGPVYRALRWLKKHQESDGCWKGTSGGGKGSEGVETALTGLALLTYLAHGETPGDSPEFGATVEKAIRWLLRKQASDGFPRPYQHPIATYALAEATAMTRLISVRRAADQASRTIIAGQNPSGGFDYQLNNTRRDDTSVMGWCAQALKAAKIARLDSPGLEACMERAVAGFKKNFQGSGSSGGFGYTGPGQTGLTGVGAVCLQLLGQGDAPETKAALNRIVATDAFRWDGRDWKKVYYLYYDIQARFQEGGNAWADCTDKFLVPLARAQVVEPRAIQGPRGRMVDIGYWDTDNDRGGRVMDTTLCTLTLEIYYRYLGTYRKAEDIVAELAPQQIPAQDPFVEIVRTP